MPDLEITALCHNMRMHWTDIASSLHTLQTVGGGYTSAKRGIVDLADGSRAFVKLGTDDNTNAWAQKEIAVYRFLAKHGYQYGPQLMACSADETAFALELLPSPDWDWQGNWSVPRLKATLAAMDSLAALTPHATDTVFGATNMITETADGWRQLVAAPAIIDTLRAKLRDAGHMRLAETLDIPASARQSAQFMLANDTLVHNDVRADNAAWNADRKTVRLIDWNWAQVGDKRIDVNSMLVNVRQAGLDVARACPERLDADALQWLAGFWLHSAALPLWPGASEQSTLRDFQLAAGVAALNLMYSIKK